MRLHELYLVAFHARKGGAAGILEGLRGEACWVDCELGPDHRAVGAAALCTEAAEQRLGSPLQLTGAVRVAGVEEDAAVVEGVLLADGGVEGGLQRRVVVRVRLGLG